jgi:hypothetical protein
VRFGESDEGLELAGGGGDALLGCAWVIAHVAHVEVGFDEFVACFFGYDRVGFGSGVVYVGREFWERL